jgi:xanthine dehydrogenase accessory factor
VIPKAELLIVGHGRIPEVLTELGSLMNFSVTVNDPTVSRDKFPHADRLINDDMNFDAYTMTPTTYVVIATQHKADHIWVQKALEGNAAYIGLVASRKRSKLVMEYARGEGVPEDKLERVSAPAGLDLGATTPEEIALSIMSEIIALRRGRDIRTMGRKADQAAEADSASEPAAERAGKVISHCDT